MIKLPEPTGTIYDPDAGYLDTYQFTESQMRQAIKDAYEAAAKVCDEHLEYPSLTPRHCADTIRKLKEELK